MLGGAAPCAHAPAAKNGAAGHDRAQRQAGPRDFAGLLGAASGASAAQSPEPASAPEPEPTQQTSTVAPQDGAGAEREAVAETPADTDTDADADTDTGSDTDADAGIAAAGDGTAAEAETPPLLNWLCGLIAATGSRGVPSGPVEPAAPPVEPPRMLKASAAGGATARGDARHPTGPDAAPPFAPGADLSAALADPAAAALAAPGDGVDFSAEMLTAPPDASSRPLPQLANALALGVSELRREAPVAASTPAALVDTPLSTLSPDFLPDLGEHIVWQLDQGVSEAKIELHPAELGALTVRIETRGDQASVHIVAAEAATRAMLSQALPQLRELLGGSGLQLARSHIESGGRRDERSGERGQAPQSEPGPRRRISRVVLVDAYA